MNFNEYKGFAKYTQKMLSPFKSSLDAEILSNDLLKVCKTKKTEFVDVVRILTDQQDFQ